MQRTTLLFTRTATRSACAPRPLVRFLNTTAGKPHAFLTPASTLVPNSKVDLEGVMALVLDRPEARNALSMQLIDEMREAIAKVANDKSTRVLLVQGNGPVFCAGADLRERRTMSQERVNQFLNDMNDTFSELEALPLPTIAVVPGPALGGGTELALCADIRVGSKDTALVLPEVKLGIIPGAGGTQRMTHLIGRSKAMEIIFTGRKVGAEEAARIGLIDIIAKPDETALEAAANLAGQMLSSAPLSLRAAKQAIKSAAGTPIKEGLKLERAAYETLLHSEDRLEGLKAFAEKRKPNFLGR